MGVTHVCLRVPLTANGNRGCSTRYIYGRLSSEWWRTVPSVLRPVLYANTLAALTRASAVVAPFTTSAYPILTHADAPLAAITFSTQTSAACTALCLPGDVTRYSASLLDAYAIPSQKF